jgi:hypothetical protein
MPAQLFPTSNLKWGDVVNVTGPFQGLHQGQIRVKFQGASWQAPAMQGPFSASVRVPEGAETGVCAIEVNGRRVFGTQCTITPATGFRGQKVAPARGPYGEAWKDFGDKSLMGFVPEGMAWKVAAGFAVAEADYRFIGSRGRKRFDTRYIAEVILGALLL